jgi:hypothetical protein
MRKRIILTFSIVFLFSLVYSQNNEISFEIKEKTYVDIDVFIQNDSMSIASSLQNTLKYSFKILPLPFELSEQYSFESAPDIKLSVISSGNNYCVLSIISPSNSDTKFRIKNGYQLKENTEGKSMMYYDASFSFASNPEKELFLMPNTINKLNLYLFTCLFTG